MEFMRKNYTGILVCFGIAVPAWLLGKAFPIIGGPVLSILFGMLIALFWSDKGKAAAGIKWTSKIILQTAVVLLGFGLNLGVIFETGKQSLPIIVCTISISLLLAWALHKALRVPSDTAILVGVGSSICGGSAIAATAPVIGADDNEVAQSISVISNRTLDFGPGFYTTSDKSRAERWTELQIKRRKKGAVVISVYDFDEAQAGNLAILRFEETDQKRLNFVTQNRKNLYNGGKFDLVIGPVTNETTMPVLSDYMAGNILEGWSPLLNKNSTFRSVQGHA